MTVLTLAPSRMTRLLGMTDDASKTDGEDDVLLVLEPEAVPHMDARTRISAILIVLAGVVAASAVVWCVVVALLWATPVIVFFGAMSGYEGP